MGGVLLKKKKVIVRSKRFTPRVWRTAWNSWSRRRLKKKLSFSAGSQDLLKKKSRVSPHKKYKVFKRKIRSNESARTTSYSTSPQCISFVCKKSCKLNFSTMVGIKAKALAIKKSNISVNFKKFPTMLLTRKSTGHRMGKGKGKFSARIARYKKNEIIFEISFFDRGVFDSYYNSIIKSFPVLVKAVVRPEAKCVANFFENTANVKRAATVISRRRMAARK